MCTILFLIDSLLPSLLSSPPPLLRPSILYLFHTLLKIKKIKLFHLHLPLLCLPYFFTSDGFFTLEDKGRGCTPLYLPPKRCFQVVGGFQPESRNITFLMWSNVKHWPNCDPRCLYWPAPYEKVMLWGSIYLQESGNYRGNERLEKWILLNISQEVWGNGHQCLNKELLN